MVDTATTPTTATTDVPLPRWSRWQPFVDAANEARHRRPADIVTLVLGSLLLAVMSARAGEVSDWEGDVASFFLDLPSWVSDALEWVLRLGSLWAVLVLAAGLILLMLLPNLRRKRREVFQED